MKIRAVLWLTLALLPAAFATTITYTVSTSASGTLNGSSFSDNTITFTQVSDTTLVGTCFGGTDLCPPESTSNTVTIQGIGTFTINDSSVFFDNPSGIAGVDINDSDALTEDDAAFNTYNMVTAIGPIFDTTESSGFSGISTSGGILTFSGNSIDTTFTAVLGSSSVPEPGSLGLMLAGAMIAGLKIVRKNRLGIAPYQA
jgi:hypothetical protein